MTHRCATAYQGAQERVLYLARTEDQLVTIAPIKNEPDAPKDRNMFEEPPAFVLRPAQAVAAPKVLGAHFAGTRVNQKGP